MSTNTSEDKKILLKLRDIRREKGLSLNALAKKAGMEYQRIGRIERGETQMTVEILNRLAKVLKVPIAELLEDEDINKLENNLSHASTQPTSIYLIPTIYDNIEVLCKKHNIDIENSAKVHVATMMFKAIQDIRTTVKDDEDMVIVLFQVFDAILGRLVLTQSNEDDKVR